MTEIRRRLWQGTTPTMLVGVGVAVLLSLHAGYTGTALDLQLLLALGFLAVIVITTIWVPHIVVAVTIPVFAAIPALKVLVVPWIGPVKDAVILGAAVGAGILAVQRRLARDRQPIDVVALALAGTLLGLYGLNLGRGFEPGAYGGAWVHGLRLTAEPLLLLLVGLSVHQPRRVLRWGLASLIATTCAVALYGLLQQRLGEWSLVGMGYEWDVNVRTIDGHLRSFGTLDDPFAYAAFLLFGIGALLFAHLRVPVATIAAVVLLAGLAASLVRTTLVILVALVSLWLGKHDHLAVAALLLAGCCAASVVLLVTASAAETRTVQAAPSTYLSINGRTDVWRTALGAKSEWVLGRGVGVVGTAADRASFGVYRSQEGASASERTAVDSGYLAALANVGIVGLIVLLALLFRLAQLCTIATRRGDQSGWIGAGLLTVMALDAATRDSFIGFPTAFVGMLLVGVAINAGMSEGARDRRG